MATETTCRTCGNNDVLNAWSVCERCWWTHPMNENHERNAKLIADGELLDRS